MTCPPLLLEQGSAENANAKYSAVETKVCTNTVSGLVRSARIKVTLTHTHTQVYISSEMYRLLRRIAYQDFEGNLIRGRITYPSFASGPSGTETAKQAPHCLT